MTWSTLQSSNTSVASGNLTLSEPASSVAGDILVALIAYRSNVAFTLPAGWTLMAQENLGDVVSGAGAICSGLMAYIVRGGSAPSFAFTRTGGDAAIGTVMRVRSNRQAWQYSGNIVSNTNNPASTLASNAGITTTLGHELLFLFTGNGVNNTPVGLNVATDPTAGWSVQFAQGTTLGADAAYSMAQNVKATPGATGAGTANNGTSGRHVLFLASFQQFIFLTADHRTFTFTGQTANFLVGRIVVGANASFTLNGQAAELLAGRKVVAAHGTFDLTGQTAELTHVKLVQGDTGIFSMSGGDAVLTKLRRNPWYEEPVEAGAWTEAPVLSNSWSEQAAPSNVWTEEAL